MSDVPIEPDGDAKPFGAEVIDLAGIRIEWGRPVYRDTRPCEHKALVYSQNERRVWCKDCERTIDNFDAFMIFAHYFNDMLRAAKSKAFEAANALKVVARLRAVKQLDRIWSGNVMAIECPHCKGGLLPEDFANGARCAWSRDLELAKRRSTVKP